MNSSEIMVAVRSGNGWKVSCLTGIKGEDGSVASDGLADPLPQRLPTMNAFWQPGVRWPSRYQCRGPDEL